jgi:hypothetical protein
MKEQPKILIIHESVKHSLARDAGTFALVVGVIGTGVFLQSSAMQWAGFIMLALAALALASNGDKRMTVTQARAYLDEIEKERRAP